ncbi:polysaccharide deacetylase family protein [Altererythrobacter aerius]|uniref:Chitooligosaccharide deacetylase n=1 Tax=Tsuneonella aeria TaxID=1837929 RepID=A0A6I4TEI2_9SPHN|nr:polysaccharide deacetylase family protein [Tsuneonella aeria]
MSAADLRSLVRGGMTVGLHGRDHLDWRRLDENALADELVGARHTIAAAAGRSVDEVAIPFGAYDRRVIRRLQEEGFARILTSDRGTFRPSARIWNRTSIRDDMTDAEIGAILSGHARPATRIRRAASRFARRHLR